MGYHRTHPSPHKVPGTSSLGCFSLQILWDSSQALFYVLLIPGRTAPGCLRTVASGTWSDFRSPNQLPSCSPGLVSMVPATGMACPSLLIKPIWLTHMYTLVPQAMTKGQPQKSPP